MRKMAVNNDKNLNLQITEKSDMLLFAEDLVDYLLFQTCDKCDLKWKPVVFRNHSYNTSVPIIRRILHFIAYALEGNHDSIFNKMKKTDLLNSNSYEKFDKILVSKYFPGKHFPGFEAKYFLLYCVNLSVMAACFYIDGIHDAPNLAKQYIYQLLQKYDALAGGWKAICKTAENYVKLLRDSLDGIERQAQEQEKVTTDESSASRSDGKSVSSGNAKNNIEFRASLNIKEYLMLDAQYSSKSESQIGLCSLREPESSSEYKSSAFTLGKNMAIDLSKSDKQRPGASNVDQELILIISDFRKQTNFLWHKIMLIGESESE